MRIARNHLLLLLVLLSGWAAAPWVVTSDLAPAHASGPEVVPLALRYRQQLAEHIARASRLLWNRPRTEGPLLPELDESRAGVPRPRSGGTAFLYLLMSLQC